MIESLPSTSQAAEVLQDTQIDFQVETLSSIQQQAIVQALVPVLQSTPEKKFITVTAQAQTGGSALVCFVELRESPEHPPQKLVVKTVLEGAVAYQVRSMELELFIRGRLARTDLTAALPTRVLAMSAPPTEATLVASNGSLVLPRGELGIASYFIVTEFVEDSIEHETFAFIEKIGSEFRIKPEWGKHLAFLQDVLASYGQVLDDLLSQNIVLHDLKLDNILAVFLETLNTVQVLLPDLGSATVLLNDGSSVPDFPAMAGYAGLPLPTSAQLTDPDVADAEKFPAINFEAAQYLSKLNLILTIWQDLFGQVHRHLQLSPIGGATGYDTSGELGTIATLHGLTAAAMAYDAIEMLILTAPQPVSETDVSIGMLLETAALNVVMVAEPATVTFTTAETETINKTLQMYLLLLLDPASLTPDDNYGAEPEDLLRVAPHHESILNLAEEMSYLLAPAQLMQLSYAEIVAKVFAVVTPFLNDYAHTRSTT